MHDEFGCTDDIGIKNKKINYLAQKQNKLVKKNYDIGVYHDENVYIT